MSLPNTRQLWSSHRQLNFSLVLLQSPADLSIALTVFIPYFCTKRKLWTFPCNCTIYVWKSFLFLLIGLLSFLQELNSLFRRNKRSESNKGNNPCWQQVPWLDICLFFSSFNPTTRIDFFFLHMHFHSLFLCSPLTSLTNRILLSLYANNCVKNMFEKKP